MKKYWTPQTTYWLRIIIVLCGLLANASVLNNFRNVSSDFVQDYIAASSLRRGGSLYGEDFKKLKKELVGFGEIQNFHPPFNALLFLPLSFLSYQTSYVFLGVLSILLLFLINKLIVRGLEFRGEWLLNFMCFTLFWHPVFGCLGTGQSSMIIAACLIGGWFYLRFEKACIAGLLFAIATLMKLFPGLVLLYLLMMKNWRALFGTIFFIILGMSITALVIGLDDMRTYSTVLIARNINEWEGFVCNHSVTGIVTKIFGERTGWTEPLIQLPRISSLLVLFLNSFVLIYTALKMSKMTAKQGLGNYAFGLTMVAMLLLSPITWGHIFPVLILPIGLLLREYIYDPSSRKLRLLLLIIIFISLPNIAIARWLMAAHYPLRIPWYNMLLTLGSGAGIVLLWIVLIRRARISKC